MAGLIETKTNLSPARASQLGLSLALTFLDISLDLNTGICKSYMKDNVMPIYEMDPHKYIGLNIKCTTTAQSQPQPNLTSILVGSHYIMSLTTTPPNPPTPPTMKLFVVVVVQVAD